MPTPWGSKSVPSLKSPESGAGQALTATAIERRHGLANGVHPTDVPKYCGAPWFYLNSARRVGSRFDRRSQMIEMDAKSRKNILSSLFKRRGGSGRYTALFEDLDTAKQNILLTAVELNSMELPIIGSVENSDNWFFLTTNRLIWSVDGQQAEILSRSIIAANSDTDAIRRGGYKVK
jgi:hypothetical protein